MTYLDRVKAPLLVIQGVNDPRVPAGEAIQIHDQLAKRGVSSPLILFADEGHGASKRANRVLEIGHVIRFFEENLKGRRRPDDSGGASAPSSRRNIGDEGARAVVADLERDARHAFVPRTGARPLS